MRIKFFFFLILAIWFSSCKILNPSIMFRAKNDYKFDIPPDTISPQYRLSPNDYITFQLFANDGFKIIDMMSGNSQDGGANMRFMQQGSQGGFRYRIMPDSTVKLPSIGWVKLAGFTLVEAELYLQKAYSEFYNEPFVILNVQNRRVLVFPGSDGQGTQVTLENENVTLIEVLALAGGLSQNGKAHKIKVIRNLREGSEPQVFMVDLSTINGLAYADMVMQANDIVYVEPRLNIASDALREITPIIALLTSTLLIISLFNNN